MIAICLATYNGEKYLAQQLDSLIGQTYKKFDIYIRDDGSSDGTLKIINQYKNANDNIYVISDSKLAKSAKQNFSIILEYVFSLKRYKYFMFCDQDDVWFDYKITKSMKEMNSLESKFKNTALLVHSDLEVVDESLHSINKSFWNYVKLEPSLNTLNRLVLQNTITGCTMLFNAKLVELSLPLPTRAIMHDWWIGLVVSQFGYIGIINEPLMKYRQHYDNSIGAQRLGIQYLLEKQRKKNLIQNHIMQASAFLQRFETKIDTKKIQVLENFLLIQKSSFFIKIYILIKYKLFKQGFIRNIGLLIGK